MLPLVPIEEFPGSAADDATLAALSGRDIVVGVPSPAVARYLETRDAIRDLRSLAASVRAAANAQPQPIMEPPPAPPPPLPEGEDDPPAPRPPSPALN